MLLANSRALWKLRGWDTLDSSLVEGGAFSDLSIAAWLDSGVYGRLGIVLVLVQFIVVLVRGYEMIMLAFTLYGKISMSSSMGCVSWFCCGCCVF